MYYQAVKCMTNNRLSQVKGFTRMICEKDIYFAHTDGCAFCLLCVPVELAQMWPERPSFVSSDNRDVHVPPELSGLIQEPHIQLSNER